MNWICRILGHHELWSDDQAHDAYTGKTWIYMDTCTRCGQPITATSRR